jgi:hypothetical protein
MSDIEFEFRGQELPGDARFDSSTEDLVFPGEQGYDEDDDSEEGDSEDDDDHECTKKFG